MTRGVTYSSRPLRRLFVIALALAALSACGRRGALEAPPQPGAAAEPAPSGQIVPGPQQAPPEPKRRNDPFILDRLLD
jgi:predicted small lipoprotein YifL